MHENFNHMDWIIKNGIKKCNEALKEIMENEIVGHKEANTMQVTYNGFTGELVKLERTFAPYPYVAKYATYDLTITILKEGVCADVHFTSVRLEDVEFSGGEVSFSG